MKKGGIFNEREYFENCSGIRVMLDEILTNNIVHIMVLSHQLKMLRTLFYLHLTQVTWFLSIFVERKAHVRFYE